MEAKRSPKSRICRRTEDRFMADKRTLAGRRLSDFRLLGHLECIVYLDPKVSHGAFNFCMC